jgi:elongation factor Ts
MISAASVKELRERTSAGMMDCKRALEACEGDMEKAIEYLREKGLAAAAKKAGRVAKQGLIVGKVQGKKASLLEVNCETDFVAKNDDFQLWVNELALLIIEKQITQVEDLLNLPYAQGTVQSELTNKIATIGENMGIRRLAYYDVEPTSVLDLYIHGGGKIGVLIELSLSDAQFENNEQVKELIHDLALQIAAGRAQFISSEEVPAEVIAKEREIYLAQAINEGKPANIAERMVEGRIRKYYEEICLLHQAFVKDTDLTIAKLLVKVGKEVGCSISVKSFTRFEIGEGFEATESENE